MVGEVLLTWVAVSLVVFVLGCAWRAWWYWSAPVHLRWDLYPVAHEPRARREHGGSYLEEKEWWKKARERSLWGELLAMLGEIVLLQGVRENNRRLWRVSLPFHWGLYLLVITSVGVFAAALGWSGPVAKLALGVAGGTGGLLLALGAGGLLVLRSTDAKLKPYTTPLDRLNLGVLLVFGALSVGIALSGGGVWGAATALADAARGRPAPIPPLVAVHAALGALFLFYLPFTRMVHLFAKYFTYHEVRWDDEPLEPGSPMARRLRAALEYGVDWSAEHVGAGRSWGEVATSPPPAETKGGA